MKRQLQALLLAACGLGAATGAEAAYPNDLRLLSHNVYMLSTNLYPNWGQNQRAGMIANASYMKNQDVVILNEAFDNTASTTLLQGLSSQYPYQTPVLGRSTSGWNETLGAYSSATPEDGGVAIVSRWPIVEKVQYVYADGCGADAMSNKGFVYAKINRNGEYYHVIGTHVQAEDSSCGSGEAKGIRIQQFQAIADFVRERNIPANEVVFIGGDMNVNRHNSYEYQYMMSALNAANPTSYAGVSTTWDPKTNDIAYYNYPNDASEYLDYIFVDSSHAQPSQWQNLAIDPLAPQWKVTATSKTYWYTDYSDHYPVMAYANANASTPTRSFKPTGVYDNVSLRNVATGKLVGMDAGQANGWLTAKSSAENSMTQFKLGNGWHGRGSCIRSGDYVKLEGLNRSGYFWDWYGYGSGTYGYYSHQGTWSRDLRMEIQGGTGACLKQGDVVALKDWATVADKYVTVWPSGSWKDYLFVWEGAHGNREHFTLNISSQPNWQDWSSQLLY